MITDKTPRAMMDCIYEHAYGKGSTINHLGEGHGADFFERFFFLDPQNEFFYHSDLAC